MAFSKSQLPTICFSALLFIGAAFSLFGQCAVPVLPYFQLDAMLSRDELADVAKMQTTLTLLERANGSQWVIWTGAGLLVVAFSALGLYAERVAKRAERLKSAACGG